jgi:Flp pilus assembly protein TadG
MIARLRRHLRRAHLRFLRCQKDEAGFTAVEFAMIAMPFMMLLFGIISVCLFFFTTFSMENAVWQAARTIRTGQFQQGVGIYSGLKTDDDRKKAFKTALCAKAPPFVDCNKVVIMVQSNSGGFGSITQPACSNNGTIVDQSAAKFDAGGASSVVMVTACYPWSFGGNLPFITLSDLKDGSLLIQASAAFRTEPFPSN